MRRSLLAFASALLLAPAAYALPVTFSAGTSITIVGSYSQSGPLESHFVITNTGSQPLTLGLERQMLSEVGGSQNNFCFGPNCYPPHVGLAPSPIIIAAGGTDNTFVGDYMSNGYAGITRIRYAFYDVDGLGAAADTAYVTVTYDATQRVTGLANSLATSKLLSYPAPNPAVAGTDVVFTLAANAPKDGALHLIDLRDGRTVHTVTIGQEGAGWSFCGTTLTTPEVTSTTAGCTSSGCCGSCTGNSCAPSTTMVAQAATTVRLTTAGLAAGVYGCQLVDASGHPRAMHRLVVQ